MLNEPFQTVMVPLPMKVEMSTDLVNIKVIVPKDTEIRLLVVKLLKNERRDVEKIVADSHSVSKRHKSCSAYPSSSSSCNISIAQN